MLFSRQSVIEKHDRVVSTEKHSYFLNMILQILKCGTSTIVTKIVETSYDFAFFFRLFKKMLEQIMVLLSSIYIRRKYWIRKNFRHSVFDGFTCFGMSRTRMTISGKCPSVCLCICVCVTKILWQV